MVCCRYSLEFRQTHQLTKRTIHYENSNKQKERNHLTNLSCPVSINQSIEAMDKPCSFMSCDKLDRVANWVGANVATAFFASLERCSCINLSTAEFEDEDEAKDRPLMVFRSTVHGRYDLDAQHANTTVSNVNKLQ
ncbi:hypothetical protein CICLE_v10022804mg [Citrus x clementina]|uniref:Uncharacterized protein n=3 Tax=Citrus TaxID=2706 RepID=A0A067HEW0_CITSI|nr:hypothetical protein CICLE_v10022804mg [Citrus x clementina]KDO86522.1 hypothetical protein CISIN_1g032712mg [Citrus sinensis]